MSYIRVAEMLIGGIDYNIVLSDHLRHNVYPPVPEYVDEARRAIDAIVADEPDSPIRLDSGNEVSAREVVEGLHLEAFVDHKRTDDDAG